MNIIEIQLEVSKYLSRSELAVCVLVSKEWFTSFIVMVYRVVHLRKGQRGCQPQDLSQLSATLYRYRSHIESLTLGLGRTQAMELLTLTDAWLQSEDEGTMNLEFSTKATISSTSPAVATTTTTASGTIPAKFLFPKVETLVLNVYCPMNEQLQWVAHCPHVQSLHLVGVKVPRPPSNSPLLRAAIPELDLSTLRRCSNNLTQLSFSGGFLEDVHLAQMLEQCPHLTDVSLSGSQLGTRTFEALKPLFPKLLSLNLEGYRDVEPRKLQNIWNSCPALLSFACPALEVETLFGNIFFFPQTNTVNPASTWACTGLKRLSIVRIEWSRIQEPNTRVLEQWSRLKELEFLQLTHMRGIGRAQAVQDSFPVKLCWTSNRFNAKPPGCMLEVWPKLKSYQSSGWEAY